MSNAKALSQSRWLAVIGVAGLLACGELKVAEARRRAIHARATLVRGAVGTYGWEVSVSKAAGVGADEPCLNIRLADVREVRAGVAPRQFVCGRAQPAPIVFVYSVGRGRREKTVIAIGSLVSVGRITIDAGRRGLRRYQPGHLTRKQSEVSGLDKISWIADIFSGPLCIHRVSTYENEGQAMPTWSSGYRRRC